MSIPEDIQLNNKPAKYISLKYMDTNYWWEYFDFIIFIILLIKRTWKGGVFQTKNQSECLPNNK